MKGDLSRPHPHAWERVGYVFVRQEAKDDLEIIDYVSIPDEFYIENSKVGAHIDHRAIVMAMKRADQNKEGVLQVHEHSGKGVPHFSQVDIDSHLDYLRSFRNANPRARHGFLLLSDDKMMARIWEQGEIEYKDILHYKVIEEGLFYLIMGIFKWIGRKF
jgi:hypothetical protein